jgi:Transposase zinc-binding domain
VTRPPWEVADIIHRAGSRFIERYRSSFTWAQLKVLRAIECCRTAALGGHRDQCLRCGHQAISYNSCRNRHCPKCQTNAREKWLRAWQQEILAVNYYHLVFSVPHGLVPLIWQNQKILFALLFEATAATPTGSSRRSQTPRRRDWFPRHSACLGSDTTKTSTHSLRSTRRRAVAGP